MRPDRNKFHQIQEADSKTERKIMWGEILVLVLLAIISAVYAFAFA